jgi:hypothetical protein
MKLTAKINRFLSVNLPVHEAAFGPDGTSCEVCVPRNDVSVLIGPGVRCELEDDRKARRMVIENIRLLENAIHLYCVRRAS